jgi:hypothetical protein
MLILGKDLSFPKLSNLGRKNVHRDRKNSKTKDCTLLKSEKRKIEETEVTDTGGHPISDCLERTVEKQECQIPLVEEFKGGTNAMGSIIEVKEGGAATKAHPDELACVEPIITLENGKTDELKRGSQHFPEASVTPVPILIEENAEMTLTGNTNEATETAPSELVEKEEIASTMVRPRSQTTQIEINPRSSCYRPNVPGKASRPRMCTSDHQIAPGAEGSCATGKMTMPQGTECLVPPLGTQISATSSTLKLSDLPESQNLPPENLMFLWKNRQRKGEPAVHIPPSHSGYEQRALSLHCPNFRNFHFGSSKNEFLKFAIHQNTTDTGPSACTELPSRGYSEPSSLGQAVSTTYLLLCLLKSRF